MSEDKPVLINNDFPPQAALLWNKIPQDKQQLILNNVYCIQCCVAVTMVNISGLVEGSSLVLKGSCGVCGGYVARVIEELN